MLRGQNPFGSGQKETVFRGERTHPKVILVQCAGLSLAGAVATWAVIIICMFWIPRPFRWLGEVWRWPASISVGFVVVGAVLGVISLFIEVQDPNYPATRNPVSSSRPLFWWSREQGNRDYDQYKSSVEVSYVNPDDYVID